MYLRLPSNFLLIRLSHPARLTRNALETSLRFTPPISSPSVLLKVQMQENTNSKFINHQHAFATTESITEEKCIHTYVEEIRILEDTENKQGMRQRKQGSHEGNEKMTKTVTSDLYWRMEKGGKKVTNSSRSRTRTRGGKNSQPFMSSEETNIQVIQLKLLMLLSVSLSHSYNDNVPNCPVSSAMSIVTVNAHLKSLTINKNHASGSGQTICVRSGVALLEGEDYHFSFQFNNITTGSRRHISLHRLLFRVHTHHFPKHPILRRRSIRHIMRHAVPPRWRPPIGPQKLPSQFCPQHHEHPFPYWLPINCRRWIRLQDHLPSRDAQQEGLVGGREVLAGVVASQADDVAVAFRDLHRPANLVRGGVAALSDGFVIVGGE
ncbi:uncharacterized protein G2W53_025122 [Senna tora]|uniref:Uncharacterized protein n=1 Tax=Senna tora TaxID=362788 RepID=A0A834WEH0_9FABA|nr:uncharacterized protein G2W53_025122 [Senna tora]